MTVAASKTAAVRWLDSRFRISERGSNIGTECIGGAAVFASLAYIFVVNPALLAQAGLDHRQVFYATVIVSGLATVILGAVANLPLAIAPGMEFNAYLALAVAPQLALGPADLLGVIAWAGLMFLALTLTGLRATFVEILKEQLGSMLAAIVGAFLVAVALRVTGIFEYGPRILQSVHVPRSPQVLVFAFSALGLLGLKCLRVRGSPIITILGSALALRWLIGTGENHTPSHVAVGYILPNMLIVKHAAVIGPILLVSAIDFLGSASKIVALTAGTSASGPQVTRGMQRAMLIDASGSASAAWLGTSPVTIYVESAAAIQSGARTGLAAIVCGAAMLATAAFEPMVSNLPAAAATGTLFVIGIGILLDQIKGARPTATLTTIGLAIVTIVCFAVDLPLALALLVSPILLKSTISRLSLVRTVAASMFVVVLTLVRLLDLA